MKKLLTILGALTISATATTTIVACNSSATVNDLTKSLKTSYTMDATGKLTDFGLTKTSGEETYVFKAKDFSAGLSKVITDDLKDGATVKLVFVTEDGLIGGQTVSSAGVLAVGAMLKDASDLKVDTTTNTVTVQGTFTLSESQAKKDDAATFEYVSTGTTMDFALNIMVAALPVAPVSITGTTVADQTYTAATADDKKYSDLIADPTISAAILAGVKTKASTATAANYDLTVVGKQLTDPVTAGANVITVTAKASDTLIKDSFTVKVTSTLT